MKGRKTGLFAVMLVIIAVAVAGCTGSAPGEPAAGTAQPGGAASSGGSTPGSASAADLFGADYNWVEYKTTSNTGGEQMSIYMKWTKAGKCTMRFEGADAEMMAGMPTEFDCSSTGSEGTQSDPNDVGSDVNLVKTGTETITVGAGTFVADKYTLTTDGITATYWFAAGKPVLKMASSAAEGSVVTELNGWG